jgi:hypothetical protein
MATNVPMTALSRPELAASSNEREFVDAGRTSAAESGLSDIPARAGAAPFLAHHCRASAAN